MSTLTYRDGRYYRDGEPLFVIASDYQYYRDRRDHWRDRLTKLRDGGINVITFYTPWRHHLQWDEGRRWYDFEGRSKDSRDLVGFLETIRELGLWMIVKPGPFTHSELNVGGLPDLVSPSFSPAMPAAQRHHGGPVVWTYDASKMPAPFDETFDALCREYLEAVGKLIAPYAQEGGPLIGLQLNDETIFCMSNDPPWNIGYEPSGMRHFQHLMRERYGSIAKYNQLHGTDYPAWEFIRGPALRTLDAAETGNAPGPRSREDLLQYIDWAEYQWRLRRDLYVRYEDYLGIDHLPYLTNYAGITPPIEENVPDLQHDAVEEVPADYLGLYPEWWFAMNRIDSDRDAYHYGMISWLGVAAYDRDVFDRYINTARRARGINMEENWGFGMLYDQRSRHPVIPFFQTLVSIAGGATGYDVFVGVSTDYWDDSLDRITKLQCPTFPSDAPIDEHGNCRPMYDTMVMLNRWFIEHGSALLECEIDIDCAYLLYAPYAAVSSWVPDARYWHLDDAGIPRCGHQGFEEFSRGLQRAGYSFGMFELEAATEQQLQGPRALAIHSAFFMDAASQDRLAGYVESGGRLFISGALPEVDIELKPCTRLKEAIATSDNVVYREENFFAEERFAETLAAAEIHPQVTYDESMRAYVHHNGEDYFIFFFNFDVEGSHDRWVEFYGQRIELRLGSKTSGVVRIRDRRLAGYLVKGENEVEGIRSSIRIQFGDEVIEADGDFSSCD
jgi:beta-galactosidase